MSFSVNHTPTKKEFLNNIELKEEDPDFIGDMEALLRKELKYNHVEAFKWIKTGLIEKMK